MFPVRYEQVFYVPDVGILHSHRLENIKSYIRHLSSVTFVDIAVESNNEFTEG
jgi:hypothetical protein